MKQYIKILKRGIEKQLQSGKYNSLLNKKLNNIELYNELHRALIDDGFLTKETKMEIGERVFNYQREVVEALRVIGDIETLNKFEKWLYFPDTLFKCRSISLLNKVLNSNIDLKQIDLIAKSYYFDFALVNIINEL